MSTAKNHHYVPRCYLRGFARSGGGRYPQTLVVDVVDGRAFPTSIKNVCVVRDFNTVDIPGEPPDILEKELARFDSELGSALQKILAMKTLEDEHARLVLLNFASVVAARNPFFRSSKEAALLHTYRIIGDMAVSSRTMWDSQVAAARRSGALTADLDVPYEQMRDFIREEKYKITFPSGFHIPGEFRAQDVVLRTMLDRKWSLLRAPPRTAFITSDLPACLMANFLTRRPVGYANQNTTVLLPVTASLLAMGTFGGREGAFDVPREYVAALNLEIALHCDRQIYAKSADFEISDCEGRVTVGPDLIYRIIADERRQRGQRTARKSDASTED